MTESQVADGSVALVVTSPPYFAGKEYEEALGQGHVPATYFDYLAMLEAVFAECVREARARRPDRGQRRESRPPAVPVAVVRRDQRSCRTAWVSCSAARSSGRRRAAPRGSCAWGSFQSPTNPVLRDLTERVIVASKGRFDRAQEPPRAEQDPDLPSEISLFKDEFMEATIDLWEIPPEMASTSRPSGTVPGRAPAAAHRALHVPRRPRPRSLHGLGHDGGGGDPHRALTSSATTPMSDMWKPRENGARPSVRGLGPMRRVSRCRR